MRVQVAQQAQEILGTSDLVIITERVDDVALLIGQMVKTGLPEVLDRHIPHSRWVATRRGLHKPVSSSPPFKTGLAPLRASGFTPSVLLYGQTAPRSVPSHFSNSTGVHPCTACAFAEYLCSGLSEG